MAIRLMFIVCWGAVVCDQLAAITLLQVGWEVADNSTINFEMPGHPGRPARPSQAQAGARPGGNALPGRREKREFYHCKIYHCKF